MKQQGQKLDTDNLQDVLDAGRNAARVGRQQFFTPVEIARALMLPLPKKQATFVDLTMGDGAILLASAAPELFGIDIDSRLARKPDNALGDWNCINADLTLLYPLLHEIDWKFDLCGLNPPFSVKWHKERLALLSHSECRAVRETFTGKSEHGARGARRVDGEAAQGSGAKLGRAEHQCKAGATIDSVLATMLIALDRMSERGEGFVICSEAKAAELMERPVATHVWLWLTIRGDEQAHLHPFFKDCRSSDTAVLYFARSHRRRDGAPTMHFETEPLPGADVEHAEIAIRRLIEPLQYQRAVLRNGTSIHTLYDFIPHTRERFRCVKSEWARLRDEEAGERPEWNIWLQKNGTIGRHLTPYQACSRRIPREKAVALDNLAGQMPMALVVQRASRTELLKAVHSDIWRVQPALVDEVKRCVAAYQSQRAPFYPLNEVQRLGYLDEEDTIICKREGLKGFRPGEAYKLESETIGVERTEVRPNLLGNNEKVTLMGNELAFYITDTAGQRHVFSPVHFDPTRAHAPDRAHNPTDLDTWRLSDESAAKVKADAAHDLQTLVDHFVIPEVPDVAQVRSGCYAGFVAKIEAIEARINSNRSGTQESRKAA